MEVTRREFLRMAGATSVGAVLFAGCAIPTRELLVQSPSAMPEDMVDGFDNWYSSVWSDGQTSEGVIVRVMEGRAKKVEGNPDYPTNQGKSSVRAQSALQSLYHPDRITGPMKKEGNGFVAVDWETAISEVVSKITEAGGDKTLIVTNPLRGSLGKLVNTFAFQSGAQHRAHETLEETVTRVAVQDVFGQERLPTFDFANTHTILNFGADFLGTWLSPVEFNRGYGEFRQGEGRERGYFAHVEPRMSQTAANADKWLPNKPGTEGLIALSMAYHIIDKNLQSDAAAASALTGGRGSSALAAFAPDAIASETGISADKIREVAEHFAEHTPSIALGGGPAAAQTNGLFNMKAIYSLNYLVGSVGQRGGIIFNAAFPQNDVPSVAAGASYTEWKAISSNIASGVIKVVLVRGANPAYGIPVGVNINGGLNDQFVVSFSSFMDDTAQHANIILPESHMFESWGDDIPDPGPGYATLGVRQPVVKTMYNTRNFGDVLLDIGRRIPTVTMPWPSVEEMVKEEIQLNYSRGATGMIRASSANDFWRGVLMRGGWWDTRTTSTDAVITPPALPTNAETPQFSSGSHHLIPFSHVGLTDGVGANLVWLQSTPDPLTTVNFKTWVEVNPRTADTLGLREGDIVKLSSPSSSGRPIEVPVYVHPAAAPDVLSIPFGQGHSDYGQWADGIGVNVLDVIDDRTDTTTGALAWAATKVNIEKTGKRVRMTKVEGAVPAIEPVDADIVQVTRG